MPLCPPLGVFPFGVRPRGGAAVGQGLRWDPRVTQHALIPALTRPGTRHPRPTAGRAISQSDAFGQWSSDIFSFIFICATTGLTFVSLRAASLARPHGHLCGGTMSWSIGHR